jgi:hypothetical protein
MARVDDSATPPSSWNRLALVSFLLSLVAPVGITIVQLGGGLFRTLPPTTPPIFHIGLALLFASFLTAPLAIATGHTALNEAKRGAYQQPLRALAVVGLMLGYGSLAAYLAGFVTVFWIMTHLRLHFVG